jgi:antibiotic biosynthesis monooxygenase (ABM) superfamily enzyme
MSNENTKIIEYLNLPTLPSFSKQVLTTIMIVFSLALLVDPLISPFIAGLPSLAIAMVFVLIMSPIMTILMPIVTKLLEKCYYQIHGIELS